MNFGVTRKKQEELEARMAALGVRGAELEKRTPAGGYLRGGSFDFLPYVYTDKAFSKTEISHRISDHYPLWVEFAI